MSKIRVCKPDEVLFLHGDEGDCMYIVNDGTFCAFISSFSSNPTKVAEFGAGAFFGEMSVIDGSPRSATIVCMESGTVTAVDKAHFKSLMNSNPELAKKILITLYGRYEKTLRMAVNRKITVAQLPESMKNAELLK
jgi:CRP-like cAMP-binding protein